MQSHGVAGMETMCGKYTLSKPPQNRCRARWSTKNLRKGVEDQVLWSAQNDAAYCDFKAKGFVEKLEGWSWTCVETIRN